MLGKSTWKDERTHYMHEGLGTMPSPTMNLTGNGATQWTHSRTFRRLLKHRGICPTLSIALAPPNNLYRKIVSNLIAPHS